MITVEEALALVFALVTPLPTEIVPLGLANGRFMPGPATAKRDQPPFAASAMDGYAVNGDARPGATFTVIGEADRKSTRLNSSHRNTSRMPSSA